MPSASSGEFVQRQVQLAQDAPLLRLQRVPLGVLLGLRQQRIDQPLGVPAPPRPAEPGPRQGPGECRTRGAPYEFQVGRVQHLGPDHVDHDPPHREPCGP